jgi:hypothetical protein
MAGEYEHIRGKGNRFSSTNQPKNSGRKPSLYKTLREQYPELSREDFDKMSNGLLQKSREDIEAIATDKDTPMWIAAIATALRAQMVAGKTDALEMLLDRFWGKPKSSLDVTSSGYSLKGFRSFIPDDKDLKDGEGH